MATTALKHFQGFVWMSSDGGHEWYYGHGTVVPNEAEWRGWARRMKVEDRFGGGPALWQPRIVEQGFVRRRDPDLGRTKAARNGEPIPIPQWVLNELNNWAGTQYQALPSGKPRPVKRNR